MGATISYYQTQKKDVVTRADDDHDWSNLHQDIVICFAEKIVSMKDFFAFRGVCKSWRSAAIKENSHRGLRLKHKVPVLLLPKTISDPFSNCYSLTKGKMYQLVLPETRGKMCQLGLPETRGNKCYSSLGWLIHTYVSQDYWKINLFNPLSHALIELPPLRRYSVHHPILRKFALSSSPSWTSNYAVMAQEASALAFFRPGYNNGHWTVIIHNTLLSLKDTVYYKGKFYVVDHVARVFVCDMEDPKNPLLRLVAPEIPKELLPPSHQVKVPYLVESAAGVLFLVVCFRYKGLCGPTDECRVFEVPFGNGNSWSSKSQVMNLGNTTLFLGAINSSFSIEALDDDSRCKANCIYFINKGHCMRRPIDVGIYYMENGRIERPFDKFLDRFLDIEYKGTYRSDSWIQPSF